MCTDPVFPPYLPALPPLSPQLDRRTATACRLQWLQQDHPFLTPATKKWNEKEKERLDDAVEAYGATNWKAIALAVGVRLPPSPLFPVSPHDIRADDLSAGADVQTNRSPADCLGQWRNKKVKKIGGWTKEEDELLREAVQLYGDDNWQEGTSCSPFLSSPPFSSADSRFPLSLPSLPPHLPPPQFLPHPLDQNPQPLHHARQIHPGRGRAPPRCGGRVGTEELEGG